MLKIHLLKAGEEEIERSRQKGNNRSLSILVKNTTGSSLSQQKGEEGSVDLLHFSWHVIYPTGKSFEDIREGGFFFFLFEKQNLTLTLVPVGSTALLGPRKSNAS